MNALIQLTAEAVVSGGYAYGSYIDCLEPTQGSAPRASRYRTDPLLPENTSDSASPQLHLSPDGNWLAVLHTTNIYETPPVTTLHVLSRVSAAGEPVQYGNARAVAAPFALSSTARIAALANTHFVLTQEAGSNISVALLDFATLSVVSEVDASGLELSGFAALSPNAQKLLLFHQYGASCFTLSAGSFSQTGEWSLPASKPPRCVAFNEDGSRFWYTSAQHSGGMLFDADTWQLIGEVLDKPALKRAQHCCLAGTQALLWAGQVRMGQAPFVLVDFAQARAVGAPPTPAPDIENGGSDLRLVQSVAFSVLEKRLYVAFAEGQQYAGGGFNETLYLDVQQPQKGYQSTRVQAYTGAREALLDSPLNEPLIAVTGDLGVFTGTVKDAYGEPAQRTVQAIRRSDGALMGQAQSDADTGQYHLPVPEVNTVYGLRLIAQDGIRDTFISRAVPEPYTPDAVDLLTLLQGLEVEEAAQDEMDAPPWWNPAQHGDWPPPAPLWWSAYVVEPWPQIPPWLEGRGMSAWPPQSWWVEGQPFGGFYPFPEPDDWDAEQYGAWEPMVWHDEWLEEDMNDGLRPQ